MHQVEEVSLPIMINGTLLKSESIELPPPPIHTPISLAESAVAPPPVIATQLINVPIAPAPTQQLITTTPAPPVKKVKRVGVFRD